MDGLDVFDNYAPVVSWVMVRLLLVIFLVFNLDTQKVDYTNTFYQAPVEHTVFVEMPSGFQVPNKVILLKQSVYGLMQSPPNVYRHLK